MIFLTEYHVANKEPDSDGVITPGIYISDYLGSATYMKTYENKTHNCFTEKKSEMSGISEVSMVIQRIDLSEY